MKKSKYHKIHAVLAKREETCDSKIAYCYLIKTLLVSTVFILAIYTSNFIANKVNLDTEAM